MAEEEEKEKGKKLLGLLFEEKLRLFAEKLCLFAEKLCLFEEKLRLFVFFRRAAGFFVKSNPKQQENNHPNTHCNLHISIDGPEITHFSNFSSILTVRSKKNIPIIRLNVKIINSSGFFGKKTLVPMKAMPNPAAEKFIDNPDNALSHGFDTSIRINLARSYLFVKQSPNCYY